MTPERLDKIIAVVEMLEGPPIEPSPRAKAMIEAGLAKICIRILTEKEMRPVILKILSVGRSDAGQVLERLSELRVRLEQDGEGMIFALLTNMEREGLITGSFNAEMTQKTYSITTNGSAALQREQGAVRTLSKNLEALWAT